MNPLFNWLLRGKSANQRPKIDQQNEEVTAASSAELVLQNELLLDKILKFVIHDGDTINMETTNSCKLVQHLWLERVNAKLKTFQSRPINIDAEYRSDEMIHFAQSFENSTIDRTPPFHIRIAANKYTKKEELKTCMKCFTGCGYAMEKLTLDFDNGMWPPNFTPPISAPLWLPNLHTINVRLYPGGDKPRKVDRLIRWILNGCEKLRCLSIEQNAGGGRFVLNLGKLVLPKNLTELRLSDVDDTNIFGGKNDLIYLSRLTLCLCLRRFNIERQIYPVLHRFRHQLTELKLMDTDLEEIKETTPPVVLIPHMDNLKELSCNTIGLEWPERNTSNAFFPALRKIELWNQPFKHLRKCLENVTFISVREVCADLAMGTWTCDPNFDADLILQQLKRLKAAFPNATELTVSVPYTKQMPSVNYIFEEMRHLQKLELYVRTGTKNEVYFLTALLLGISLEEVAGIQERRMSWSFLVNYGRRESSILQMRELRKFGVSHLGRGYNNDDVVLVDIVFKLIFLQMPNLQELSFGGPFTSFKPSPEVAERWKGKGRILKIQKCTIENLINNYLFSSF